MMTSQSQGGLQATVPFLAASTTLFCPGCRAEEEERVPDQSREAESPGPPRKDGDTPGLVDTQKGPLLCRLLFSGACLSSQAQSLLFVPLIMPANATPILGTVSHVLSLVGGRNKTSCPLAPASLLHPWREKSHCPVCCHEAPPAVPQGRAPCPLYMRLHDGSAEAERSPQTPN